MMSAAHTGRAPPVVIVMGVSGSGKSAVAEKMNAQLGWPYREGDRLHPPCNVQKMHAGIALSDKDRAPWLQAIKAWIDTRIAARENGLVTCSALRRKYRDLLVAGRPNVRLLYLKADRATLEARLAHRTGHFMPASLLESQLRTLEEPAPDEQALVVDAGGTLKATVAAALHAVSSLSS